MCGYEMWEGMWPLRQEEGIGFSGAGVTGSSVLPNMGTGLR